MAPSRRALKIYIALASFILAGLVMDTFVMPWIVHWRAEIAIPDVTGRPLADAQRTLAAHGLNPMFAGTTSSSSVRPGLVAYQDPLPHIVVREGRNVYLTVSGGEALVEMPSLRGRSLRDAKITVEQLDLHLGTVTYVASDLPAETVVSQGIPAGRKIPPNTDVTIDVSSGPAAVALEVPHLVGLSLDEAQQRLQESGLTVGQIAYRESADLLPNTVIGQSPPPGSQLQSNGAVDLVLAR